MSIIDMKVTRIMLIFVFKIICYQFILNNHLYFSDVVVLTFFVVFEDKFKLSKAM